MFPNVSKLDMLLVRVTNKVDYVRRMSKFMHSDISFKTVVVNLSCNGQLLRASVFYLTVNVGLCA